MGRKVFLCLLALIIVGGAAIVLVISRVRRVSEEARLAELAQTRVAETLAAVPTETPVPTVTPTSLPTETAIPLTEEPQRLSAGEWRDWPMLPETVSPKMKELYRLGIESGNRADRFSKVGDSNTITLSFLGCFDQDVQYNLGQYSDLQETIDHFQWSFSRVTRAAKNGATALDLDTYHWYDDEVCWPYESALSCEFRLFQPSIAFIALGTNDALLSADLFETHLRSLVEKTLDRQIVPILVTKADDIEGDGSFNRIIAQIAADYDVPLWNLWRAMHRLPGNGLKEGDVHPTANDVCLCDFSGHDAAEYGWTMRNLSALQALDRVWHLLNE